LTSDSCLTSLPTSIGAPLPETRLRTMPSIRSATTLMSSCSQTRSTSHPASTSSLFVAASRALFVSNLLRHHSRFAFGSVPWCGQLCQKHPSTKTAKRARVKATSTRRLRLTAPKSTLYRRPRLQSSERSATSGEVSRRRCVSIRRRASSVDAFGRAIWAGTVERQSMRTARRGSGPRWVGSRAGGNVS
jgi:hypothetical protein